jgi:hypothetical protein
MRLIFVSGDRRGPAADRHGASASTNAVRCPLPYAPANPHLSARILVMSSGERTTPLLSVGHEAEWAKLNEEKRRTLTPPADTPIEELLRRGQHLSAQAAWLLRAVEQANDHART